MSTRTIAILGLTAVLMTGCAMGGGTTAPASDASSIGSSAGEVSGEITVWSWDVAAVALERYAETYMADNPGTTINVVDTGYDNAYDKISVALQAGTGLPDLITLETERLPGYIEAFPTGFVDLAPRFGADEADFDPSKWAAAQNEDGQLFALPWDSGTQALYYRSDYLTEAGIDPGSLETWDDMVAAADAVHSVNGSTAFDTDLSTGALFLQLLQQQETGIFDAEGKIIVNSDKAVATLAWLTDLNEKGMLNNVQGWDARVSAAKAGKSTFTATAVWWMGTLKGEAPELSGKYGVVPLPVFNSGDARTSNNGGSNLVVPTQAQNPELAIDFMQYVLMDVGRQVEMSQVEGLFPSYLPALEDAVFDEPDPYFGDEPVLRTFADLTSEIPPVYYTGDFAKANEIVANATVSAILNGQDPKEALDGAANDIAQQTGREIG